MTVPAWDIPAVQPAGRAAELPWDGDENAGAAGLLPTEKLQRWTLALAPADGLDLP